MPKPRSEEIETPASCRITGSSSGILDFQLSGEMLVVNFRQGSWFREAYRSKQAVGWLFVKMVSDAV